jgi:hypothetical protein
MPRKGRLLEIMVERLEEFLAPEGVVVESPEEFYDEDGKKIGEIDVTLRGNFGSSEVFVGIECRDRPSDGAQGRDWIREIKGKRDDLKVDKMIAVSTTGFTGPAINLADSWGIDLLTIEDASKVDLQGWFEVFAFHWTEDSYEISGVVDLVTIPKTPMMTSRSALFLRSTDSDELIPLKEYIQPEIDRQFDAIQASPGVAQEIETTLEINGPIDAMADGETFKIAKMRIPVRLRREMVIAKALLNACRRLSDDEIVALTGICRIETEPRKRNIAITAKRRAADNSLDLKLDFLDDDYEPCKMPAGTRLSLFGLE